MAHNPGTLALHNQFKTVYADEIANHLSAASILQEKFPFRFKEATGKDFQMPIVTRRGHSFDYQTSGGGYIDLSDVDSSEIQMALIKGSQIYGTDGIVFEAAFSSEGDKQAFTPEFELVADSLMDSSRFRVEQDIYWGQSPNGSIGIVDGVPATSATSTVTILLAERSAGLLVQLENALVEIFDAALANKRTGPISGGFYRVLTVQPDAGTFTLDNSAGSILSTDRIYFRGQVVAGSPPTHNSAAGLHRWATNTGALAGIDASQRVMWKPNTVSAGNGPMSFDLILKVAAALGSRSHKGKLCALISLQAWNNSMSDMSAAVRRTPSERKYVLGAEAIEFYTGVGSCEVIAHPFARQGYGHVFPVLTANTDGKYKTSDVEKAPLRRVGATDLMFVGSDGTTSTRPGQKYWDKKPQSNLLCLTTYSHQTLFVSCPSRIAVITDVVDD